MYKRLSRTSSQTCRSTKTLRMYATEMAKEKVTDLKQLIPNIVKPTQKIASENTLMDDLFPDVNFKTIKLEYDGEKGCDGISSYRALSLLQLESKLSSAYVALESEDIDHAEALFYKAWRTNRKDMAKMIDATMINRFIELSLSLQQQEHRRGEISESHDHLNRALEWFNNMGSEYGVEPNVTSYELFVSFYIQTSDLKKAKETIQQYLEHKMDLAELQRDRCFSEEKDLSALQVLLSSMGTVAVVIIYGTTVPENIPSWIHCSCRRWKI